MIFTETDVDGAFVVDLEPHGDDRGFFARAWSADEFARRGLAAAIAQSNVAFTRRRATVRGLHYQAAPHVEAKLVRCTSGAIFDVVVDVRETSATYRRWFGVELTAENRRMLYVPEGCAHGYQTLVDDCETFYHVSSPYAPDSERGVRWNDEAFGVVWPILDDVHVSEKDARWPLVSVRGATAAERA